MGFSDSPKKALILRSADVDKDYSSSSSHVGNNIIGCNLLLSRPNKEFLELTSNERLVTCKFDDRRKKEGGAAGASIRPEFFASLKVKLPAPEDKGEEMEEEVVDELSTPTSSDHKIPALVCPPAPRKPKTVPSAAAIKRNASHGCRKRVFLDLTNEVESMFPEAVRADFGNKIKKVRKDETAS